MKNNFEKTVLLPIKVPPCNYCQEPHAPFRICEYFSNEGGHPICELNLGYLKYEAKGSGVIKPLKCANLIEQ